MKKILKYIFRGVMLLLLVLGIFVALNYTLLKRVATYPYTNEISDSEWYTPKGIIKGNNATNYELTDRLSIDSTALEDISNYAKTQNSNALLVLHKGKLQWEQYWNETTNESTSNSMSMAKTVIAILIGIAIDEGHIKSEKEPAATYITEWANDERNSIAIEDLLLMQSGLLNDGNTQDLFSDVIALYMGTKVEDTALKIPLDKKPATIFDHNNANTQILGIILERATGESLESYTSSRLWQPIGAADAGWWLDRKDGMPKAFCCYFAQAEDWMIIGQLLLQNGRWNGQGVIPEDWINKMLTQSTLERDYGYHIWLNYEAGGNREKDRKAPFLVKNYLLDGGHHQNVLIVPDYELVIVRIGESPSDWDESYMANKVITSMME
jgi:CubicO group peptidase (beta-lactamase class C family)